MDSFPVCILFDHVVQEMHNESLEGSKAINNADWVKQEISKGPSNCTEFLL